MKLYNCWDVVVAAPNVFTAKAHADEFLVDMIGELETREHIKDGKPPSEITEPMPWHQYVKGRYIDDDLDPEEIIALGEDVGVRGTCGDLWEDC